MLRKKTPPEKGESPGPMMVACHWNMLSPVGPAEQEDGGSRPRSASSCISQVESRSESDKAVTGSDVVRSLR